MTHAPWRPSETFGARLRVERARLGYGLQRLAEAAEAFGVTPSPFDRTHVQHWHTRTHGPRVDALQYLARVGLDVAFLVTGVSTPHAVRCLPADGLGVDRWPAPWGDDAPRIEWTAGETAMVRTLRRAHPGHVPPAWATEQTAVTTLLARHFATHPHVACPPAHRVADVARAWLAHFALPHGDVARIVAQAMTASATSAPRAGEGDHRRAA